MAELTQDAKELLQDHYGHAVRAAAPKIVSFPAPPSVVFAPVDHNLIDALEASAREFGLNSPFDWAAFVPVLMAAITTGNWFPVLPWIPQLGANAYAFILSIIALLHKSSGGGPVISG